MHLKFSIFSLVILLLIGFVSCSSDSSSDKIDPSDLIQNPNSANGRTNAKLPEIEFNKTSHDFGNVMKGEKVTYSFKFENVGDADLMITDVTASCGCTIPEYPKNKIKKGETGFITVTFDSTGKKGNQNKKITVLSNTQPSKTNIRIKAKVILP